MSDMYARKWCVHTNTGDTRVPSLVSLILWLVSHVWAIETVEKGHNMLKLMTQHKTTMGTESNRHWHDWCYLKQLTVIYLRRVFSTNKCSSATILITWGRYLEVSRGVANLTLTQQHVVLKQATPTPEFGHTPLHWLQGLSIALHL